MQEGGFKSRIKLLKLKQDFLRELLLGRLLPEGPLPWNLGRLLSESVRFLGAAGGVAPGGVPSFGQSAAESPLSQKPSAGEGPI